MRPSTRSDRPTAARSSSSVDGPQTAAVGSWVTKRAAPTKTRTATNPWRQRTTNKKNLGGRRRKPKTVEGETVGAQEMEMEEAEAGVEAAEEVEGWEDGVPPQPAVRIKGKKGKKFPDTAKMMDLIGAINEKEEGKIGNKLQKQAAKKKQLKEQHKSRRQRKSARNQELEDVKDALRQKAKKPRKKIAVEAAEPEAPQSTKKRVQFAE
ncbi:hypothetical protein BDK51DRAFT_51017 [Blyttiomyces helicus]|uniref:Uncharacterized protein n=1 Tax=Blyttiomyces helicus TaxID=388810 RepID=A0A4P9WDY8_9FUNG|nr:hypothetical protein BDK51DRAFT_51017 [Blyttiomyces helicus]|eukprot:RKO89180.1 hypothetical protein BDK51DRAFT_51017 [Blyttiomyces helicus]